MKNSQKLIIAVLILLAIQIVSAETSTCGNRVKDSGEQCDTFDLAEKTCKTLNYDDGLLKCKSDCSGFDTSECDDDITPNLINVELKSSSQTSENLVIDLYYKTTSGEVDFVSAETILKWDPQKLKLSKIDSNGREWIIEAAYSGVSAPPITNFESLTGSLSDGVILFTQATPIGDHQKINSQGYKAATFTFKKLETEDLSVKVLTQYPFPILSGRTGCPNTQDNNCFFLRNTVINAFCGDHLYANFGNCFNQGIGFPIEQTTETQTSSETESETEQPQETETDETEEADETEDSEDSDEQEDSQTEEEQDSEEEQTQEDSEQTIQNNRRAQQEEQEDSEESEVKQSIFKKFTKFFRTIFGSFRRN